MKKILRKILRHFGILETVRKKVIQIKGLRWVFNKKVFVHFSSVLFYLRNRSKVLKWKEEFQGRKVGISVNVSMAWPQVADYYLRLFEAYQYDPKSDVVMVGTSKPCNLQLAKMYERSFHIKTDDELYRLLTHESSKYIKRVLNVIDVSSGPQEWASFYIVFNSKAKIQVDFTEAETIYGWKILEKLGIRKTDRYVVIHNKDGYYWGKIRGIHKDFDTHRWSRFSDLSKSIQLLMSHNIKVIRGGHYAEDDNAPYLSLNSLHENERDFLDVFIHRHSLFSICGDSGISNLAFIFKTPLLCHNSIPWGGVPMMEKGILVPKKLYRNGKMLSIPEQLKIYSLSPREGMVSSDHFRDDCSFEAESIEVVDADPEELQMATQEMIKFTTETLCLSDEEKRMQMNLKGLFPVGHPMRHFIGIVSPFYMKKYYHELCGDE